jgi:hypothetical protein
VFRALVPEEDDGFLGLIEHRGFELVVPEGDGGGLGVFVNSMLENWVLVTVVACVGLFVIGSVRMRGL